MHMSYDTISALHIWRERFTVENLATYIAGGAPSTSKTTNILIAFT